MAHTATKLPVKSEKLAAPASFQSLRKEIDRLFDDFNLLRSTRSIFDFDLQHLSSGWPNAPAVDLAEKENEYEITAELPGIDAKNVEIKLANHTLTIKGEKTEEKEEKKKDYYLSERRYGSFQRSFQLPHGVDVNGIEASFGKGVLTVKLPKTTEAREAGKNIAVKEA